MTTTSLDYPRVARALDAALARARQQENEEGPTVLDLFTAQYVIFSDQHKGTRDGADDFLVAEPTYNGALTYYNRMGYTLVTLGDVEELWEERPGPVIVSYRNIFDLEAQYHRDGRYLRIWGNHDDNWRYLGQVSRYLSPVYGGQLIKVRETMLLQIADNGQLLGHLLLLHGHHGTLDSDHFRDVSRQLIRYVWRPFQRATRIPSNTPATNWKLRHSHNIAMYKWTEKYRKLILVAGHTHRPVFESLTNQAQLQNEINSLRQMASSPAGERKWRNRLDDLEAELGWVKSQQGPVLPQGASTESMAEPIDRVRPEAQRKPSYFNTGCCCYPDGDITGIELVSGEIRLVRWSGQSAPPKRQVLERASLRQIFARL